MKNYGYYFVILGLSGICHAEFSGQGEASIGVSYDEDDVYGGISAAYFVTGITESNSFTGNFSIEKNTDSRRASFVQGHSYQFTGNEIRADAAHRYQFSSPYFSWGTLGQYQYSPDLLIGDADAWEVSTGPRFSKDLRSDIRMDAELINAAQSYRGFISAEHTGTVGLTKAINKLYDMGLEYETICTSYDTEFNSPPCSNEWAVIFSGRTPRTDYSMRVGILTINDDDYTTYDGFIRHGINSKSSLNFRFNKQRNTIRGSQEDSVGYIRPNADRMTESVSLGYNYARFNLYVEDRTNKLFADGEELDDTTLDYKSLDMSYRLGSSSCTYCAIRYSFDDGESVLSKWRSHELSFEYPWKRSWYQEISLIQTDNDFYGDALSINWIISYYGRNVALGH
ncbi:MAG: hypothetical protein HRU20_28770 [Pseudomonadales bacterium]|nr:hypothetical protein [Pseudomonadales bacterium]